MSKIIITFIKMNVPLRVNQKIVAIEIFNPWNTLFLFFYIHLLHALKTISAVLSGINNNNLFGLKDIEKML